MSLSLSIFTKLVSERPIARSSDAIGRQAVGGSCLRGNLARLATGRDERTGTRVKEKNEEARTPAPRRPVARRGRGRTTENSAYARRHTRRLLDGPGVLCSYPMCVKKVA